jgi:hypothetical protein
MEMLSSRISLLTLFFKTCRTNIFQARISFEQSNLSLAGAIQPNQKSLIRDRRRLTL